MLMALSDVQDILIKASFTVDTEQARIGAVSMDVASENAQPSSSRAYEVEEVLITIKFSNRPVTHKPVTCQPIL